jgi:hypothetical protein
MQINFPGSSGGFSGSLADGGESHFGGEFGRGAVGANPSLSQSGNAGCVYIKEYSDASASLVGDSLVSTQMFDSASGIGAQTWTRPPNVTKIEVFCVGGGGRSFNSGLCTSGPGGGAGTSYSIIDVTDITTIIE